MILIRFPSEEAKDRALELLLGEHAFKSWKSGEVLLPEVDLASSSATEIVAKVRALWTVPLRFAEIVWGDGQSTHRQVIELADTREFGNKRFEWRAQASGWTWARVAVWDVAGNGAFVNPLWRP